MQGWGGLSAERGEFIDIIPAQQWLDDESWYLGTADAVFQSLDIIEGYRPEHVLILAGDHIYAMDYGEVLASHVRSGADFTIACYPVPKKDASEFGVMQVDDEMRLMRFQEKPKTLKTLPNDPDTALASMGIYVASFDYLREQLNRDAEHKSSSHDFGKDLIPYALKNKHHLRVYPFEHAATGGPAYWRDVGTIDAYYEASLEVLSPQPQLDLYDSNWPFRTYQPQLPAARFIGARMRCRVEDAMVSGGCVIEMSNLDRSLLYSNVKVGEGCDLQGVLALPGCEVGAGCCLKGVILDNGCVVPKGTVIGENARQDRERFHITEGGIVVVNRDMLGQEHVYVPTFAADG
jgi:glucose-1-phosphate adenylyltransferase